MRYLGSEGLISMMDGVCRLIFSKSSRVKGIVQFMGDGREMEGQIGGAARSAADLHRILEGGRSHDIPCLHVFPQKRHHLPARFLSQFFKGRVGGTEGRVSGQRKTKGLRGNAHAVGRAHKAAGSGTGTDSSLQPRAIPPG